MDCATVLNRKAVFKINSLVLFGSLSNGYIYDEVCLRSAKFSNEENTLKCRSSKH